MTENTESSEDGPRFTALYFGYASNLSPTTMKQRCPDSLYVGMAQLRDWKWIINRTHYATIVPSPGDVVYGSLSFLSNRDEAGLDRSEGVPWLYLKKMVKVTRLNADGSEMEGPPVEVLTYVDVERQEEGKIEKEYIIWVNKAIRDAINCGVPADYFEKYLRPFTPLPTPEQEVEIMMVRTLPQKPRQLPAQVSSSALAL